MYRRPLFLLAPVIVAFVGSVPFLASAQHAEHYVLDAFGGVHAGDGAPVISPATPYFGWDVAADIAFVPVGTSTASGDGILVLDKWGGVHNGGALVADPPSASTPYFGFDAARAIVARDVGPRIAFGTATSLTIWGGTGAIEVTDALLHAPDDGYLLVTFVTGVACHAGQTGAGLLASSFYIDGVQQAQPEIYHQINDCSVYSEQAVVISYVYPVSAGTHDVDVRCSSAKNMAVRSPTLTVLFIDKDGSGHS